jgi:ribulose-phosphate 3-epimerase
MEISFVQNSKSETLNNRFNKFNLMPKIAVSVLNADFSKYAEWLPEIEKARADIIQWDIMDNKFVPNAGVSPDLIQILRKKTKIYFEAHLMVEKPENYIKEFAKKGVQRIIFHVEAAKNPFETIKRIKNEGLSAGIAINSKTQPEKIYGLLTNVDLALVMSVDAGFGGQKFQENSLQKISKLRRKIDETGAGCQIEVDGGINVETGKKCVEAGAEILVAGSFIFKHKEGICNAIKELKKI